MPINNNDNQCSQEISRTTFIDAIDVCIKRKSEFGILALPSIIAALQILPQEHQLLIGTACRKYIIERLFNQNLLFRVKWYMWKNTYHTALSFLLPFLSNNGSMPQPIPSFDEEVQWLLKNIDETCPFQCLLLSEICTKVNRVDDATQWYIKGLSALRHLSKEFPDISLAIIE